MDEMLKKMLLICFVHYLPIGCYKTFWDVVRRFYSVVLSPVAIPSNNVVCFVAFVKVFDDSFKCVFVASRALFVFTSSLRR